MELLGLTSTLVLLERLAVAEAAQGVDHGEVVARGHHAGRTLDDTLAVLHAHRLGHTVSNDENRHTLRVLGLVAVGRETLAGEHAVEGRSRHVVRVRNRRNARAQRHRRLRVGVLLGLLDHAAARNDQCDRGHGSNVLEFHWVSPVVPLGQVNYIICVAYVSTNNPLTRFKEGPLLPLDTLQNFHHSVP